jgi:glc operon protein GlcG
MAILEYGPPISLVDAKRVIEAAEAEARANQWAMVIAVLDSTGHLVVLHRMDHAQYASIGVAQAKAQTALNFKRPTKVFEDGLAAGALRLLGMPDLCPLEGGIPITQNGKITGAIGVSGAQAAQDAQVAAAGAQVLGA